MKNYSYILIQARDGERMARRMMAMRAPGA